MHPCLGGTPEPTDPAPGKQQPTDLPCKVSEASGWDSAHQEGVACLTATLCESVPVAPWQKPAIPTHTHWGIACKGGLPQGTISCSVPVPLVVVYVCVGMGTVFLHNLRALGMQLAVLLVFTFQSCQKSLIQTRVCANFATILPGTGQTEQPLSCKSFFFLQSTLTQLRVFFQFWRWDTTIFCSSALRVRGEGSVRLGVPKLLLEHLLGLLVSCQ